MREILHCDMNNFYASVECREHPEWKERPLAVCGKESDRHGIVLAKNYPAKAFGVKTGETIWQAKEKCPGLLCVEPHFEKYTEASRRAFAIYREYTDLVEPFGLDECWLDVTASRRLFGNGLNIANLLRERIKKELGLTISCGISYNKVFAKLGSDLKKPDACTLLLKENVPDTVFPLPVSMMLGVGPKTERILTLYGIRTIGDLARADEIFLKNKFGKNGAWLKNAAAGNDAAPVLPDTAEPPMKSVSHGMTFPKDLTQPEEVWRAVLSLSQEIGRKLRFHQKAARGVSIVLKDNAFLYKSFQRRLPAPISSTMPLARAAYELFEKEYCFRTPLRSVTVGAIDLESTKEGLQLSLFQAKDDLKGERIDRVMDSIRARWGKGAILQATLLQNRAAEPEVPLPPAFSFPK